MINPPQVLPEEPTAVTPHGGFCGGKSQQWLRYPTKPHVRFCARGAQKWTSLPRSAVGPALTIGRRHGIYQLMKSRLTSGLALTRPEYRQRWFGGASCGHVMLVNIGQPSRCGGVPPG